MVFIENRLCRAWDNGGKDRLAPKSTGRMLSKPEIQTALHCRRCYCLIRQLCAGAGHSEITVGDFIEWPMPFQYAKVTGADDEALGTKVNRVGFDTGTAMSAAMTYGGARAASHKGTRQNPVDWR